MELIDWLIVLIVNGAVIVYGFYLARGTRSSNEWFLGNRALGWWAIGLSMFATNVDNFDIVSNVGLTYREGIHVLAAHAFGLSVGGILAAFFVIPTIYRAGYYTNSEYLEDRFGPATRVISALIQIEYRTFVLGMMVYAIYLMLTTMIELPKATSWSFVILLVVFAAIYTAWGGLKTVVMTDAFQSVILMVGTLVIFFVVWKAVGGWSGMLATLETMVTDDGENASKLVHIGQYRGTHGATSPYLVVLGWVIICCGYWTVNHTQTMRLMGSRSIWDMKMAVLIGVGLSVPVMIAVLLLGPFGRALDANIERPDQLFPYLAKEYLTTGLRGVVIAGLVAAAVSTFDSISSALSAVFTRDIYARFFVRDQPDKHYVVVGRIATPAILALGFVYLPFIMSKSTMMSAFTSMISVFVTPLVIVYVAGAMTRAHRRSGLIGLLAGSTYGLVAFLSREAQEKAEWVINWIPDWTAALPNWCVGHWEAYIWSVGFTALAIAIVTLCYGRTTIEDHSTQSGVGGWLERSRQELSPVREHPFSHELPVILQPRWYAILLLGVTAYLVFWVFW